MALSSISLGRRRTDGNRRVREFVAVAEEGVRPEWIYVMLRLGMPDDEKQVVSHMHRV
ncbi:MAG: hypothetical protein H6974_11340 [Gammaproteobacteria bacterium]|nr:hypothetical protein [Gammaproteobacteria bacterium]